jgi:hypothetical protein
MRAAHYGYYGSVGRLGDPAYLERLLHGRREKARHAYHIRSRVHYTIFYFIAGKAVSQILVLEALVVETLRYAIYDTHIVIFSQNGRKICQSERGLAALGFVLKNYRRRLYQ